MIGRERERGVREVERVKEVKRKLERDGGRENEREGARAREREGGVREVERVMEVESKLERQKGREIDRKREKERGRVREIEIERDR